MLAGVGHLQSSEEKPNTFTDLFPGDLSPRPRHLTRSLDRVTTSPATGADIMHTDSSPGISPRRGPLAAQRRAACAAAAVSLEEALEAIGCESYGSVFGAEEIDSSSIKLLSEADLRDFDIPTVRLCNRCNCSTK